MQKENETDVLMINLAGIKTVMMRIIAPEMRAKRRSLIRIGTGNMDKIR